MELLWVVGLEFQSLGCLGLQLIKLYVATSHVLSSFSSPIFFFFFFEKLFFSYLVVGIDDCFEFFSLLTFFCGRNFLIILHPLN